jgi:voltage-gated potassium channel
VFTYFLEISRKRTIRRLTRLSTNTISSRIKLLFVRLVGVLMLHAVLIAWWEGLTLGQSLWLTLTTVTTVGYGDISAATPLGQAATVILIYFMGIWMLAQLAGEYLDYRAERKERIIKGLWSWKNMKDHIVIVNAPENNTEVYLDRLVGQFRETPALAHKPIVLVSPLFPEGLPKSLVDQGLVYRKANTSLGAFYSQVNIAEACYVVFLAQNESDPRSDSVTLDLLDQFERTEKNQLVIAEAVQDTNCERFRRLGADSILRPVRAYPELIARALAAPGTERVLEDLFGYFGASIHRYDVRVQNRRWKDIVCDMVQNGLGIPLGFLDCSGAVHTCPQEDAQVDVRALLVMARDAAIPTQAAIESCLAVNDPTTQ